MGSAAGEADPVHGGHDPRAREALLEEIAELKKLNAELVRARNQALEASKAKSAFLANMSHELRTPLNAILGYSEILQEEAAELPKDTFTPDLKKIHASGKHLLALINDILDLSKIEAGKMDLFLEAFDVAGMVRDVLTTIHPLVEKNQNTLRPPELGNLGSMYSDLTKVRQVLFNLLSNASKFTERGAISLDVTATTIENKEWLTFQIRDTGIGLSDEQMEKLFQDFTQVDSSYTRKQGGSGLGLAISRRFCQMMGGELAVGSTLGKGSTFTVRMPRYVVQPGAVPPAPAKPTGAPQAPVSAQDEALPLLLVIDDDHDVLDLMQRYLTKEGFNVVTAPSGPEGLPLAKKLHPAVITLDVMMPGMDGWAVLSAIKANPTLADIPVVMLSMVTDQNLAYALGAADYVSKPIDRDRLIAVLKKYKSPHPSRPIMVVEDDTTMREMMTRLLKSLGYSVTEAANGRAALKLMETELPQIILLDLMMPEMDGFQFIAESRKREDWRQIPIIVVTAMDLTPEERAHLSGGVMQVLQKGAYTREQLAVELRQIVNRTRH